MITTGSNGPTREAGPALLHRYLLRLESVRTDIANSMTVARGLDELAHLCARKASVAFDLLQQAPLDTHEVQAGSAAKTADLGSQIHDCCQYGVEAADARWQIMDLAYAEVDTSIKDLDRRMRLLDSLLKQQGRTAVHSDASAKALGASEGRIKRARHVQSSHDAITAVDPQARFSRHRPSSATAAGGPYLTASGSAAAAASDSALGESIRNRIEETLQAASNSTIAGTVNDHLAIDPSEPVYCKCRQVAFGDMIECDNPDCSIGWYHNTCVGLGRSTRPPGKWFCSDCTRKAAAASAGAGGTAAHTTQHSKKQKFQHISSSSSSGVVRGSR